MKEVITNKNEKNDLEKAQNSSTKVSHKKPFNKDDKFSEALLGVNRVTKVVEGGRIFSFAACVVVGDKSGNIGFAKGKANEALDAKQKAVLKAKKNLTHVPLYKDRTIYHDVIGKNGASVILLKKAKPGKGIIAGPTVRAILTMCGIKDIVVKSHGSGNMYNVVRAVFNAFSQFNTPRTVAKKRGKLLRDIFSIKN